MKKEVTKEIEKDVERELKGKKKLPVRVKKERNLAIFRNLVFAIFIVVYFWLLNLGYFHLDKNVFIQDTDVFSVISLIISIILMEVAYHKEIKCLVLHGIEFLLLAIATLFAPYAYFYLDDIYRYAFMLLPGVVTVYFLFKCFCIAVTTKARYRKEQSDIKDIVRKEVKQNDDMDDIVDMDKDREAEEEEDIEEIEDVIIPTKEKTVRKAVTPATEKTTTRKTRTTTKRVKDENEEKKPKKTVKKSTVKKETEKKEVKTGKTKAEKSEDQKKKTVRTKKEEPAVTKKAKSTKVTKEKKSEPLKETKKKAVTKKATTTTTTRSRKTTSKK